MDKASTFKLIIIILTSQVQCQTLDVCPCGAVGPYMVMLDQDRVDYFQAEYYCNKTDWKEFNGVAVTGLNRLEGGSLAVVDTGSIQEKLKTCLQHCTKRNRFGNRKGKKNNNQQRRREFNKFWYGIRYRCDFKSWIFERNNKTYGGLNQSHQQHCNDLTIDGNRDTCGFMTRQANPEASLCSSKFNGFICQYNHSSVITDWKKKFYRISRKQTTTTTEPKTTPTIQTTTTKPTTLATTTTTTTKTSSATETTTGDIKTLKSKAVELLDKGLNSNIKELNHKNGSKFLAKVDERLGEVLDHKNSLGIQILVKTGKLLKKFSKIKPDKRSTNVDQFTKGFVNITSKILDERNWKSWTKAAKLKTTKFKSPMQIAQVLKQVVADRKEKIKDKILGKAISIAVNHRIGGNSSNQDVKPDTQEQNHSSVLIKYNALASLLSRLRSTTEKRFVPDYSILSYTVYNTEGEVVSVPVRFTVRSRRFDNKTTRYRTLENKKLSCQFYNYTTTRWSSYGCDLVSVGDLEATCYCNHTTTFALLLVNQDMRKVNADCRRFEVIRVVSYISCSVSAIFCVITMVCLRLAQRSGNIGNSERHVSHINLSLSVLGLCVAVVLSDLAAIAGTIPCIICACLSHFFALATFAWMTVEGLILHIYIVHGNIRNQSLGWIKFLIGWGIPLVITSVTLGFGTSQGSYIYEGTSLARHLPRICMLEHKNMLSWALSGPVLVALMFNTCLLMRVLAVIVRLSHESKKYQPSSSTFLSDSSNSASSEHTLAVKQEIPVIVLNAFVKLFPLLGVTWIIGWLPTIIIGTPFVESQCNATDILHLVFQIAHSLLNGLQGVFIFGVCILKDQYIREAMKRRLNGIWESGMNHKNSKVSGQAGKKTNDNFPQ